MVWMTFSKKVTSTLPGTFNILDLRDWKNIIWYLIFSLYVLVSFRFSTEIDFIFRKDVFLNVSEEVLININEKTIYKVCAIKEARKVGWSTSGLRRAVLAHRSEKARGRHNYQNLGNVTTVVRGGSQQRGVISNRLGRSQKNIHSNLSLLFLSHLLLVLPKKSYGQRTHWCSL